MDDKLMDLDDFDMHPAAYVVMLAVYVEEEEEFDYQPLAEFDNPEEAIECAKAKVIEYREVFKDSVPTWGSGTILGVQVTVESKVMIDGEEDFIGQLFNKTIYAKPVKN